MGDKLGAHHSGSDDGGQTACSKGEDLPPAPSSTLGRWVRRRTISRTSCRGRDSWSRSSIDLIGGAIESPQTRATTNQLQGSPGSGERGHHHADAADVDCADMEEVARSGTTVDDPQTRPDQEHDHDGAAKPGETRFETQQPGRELHLPHQPDGPDAGAAQHQGTGHHPGELRAGKERRPLGAPSTQSRTALPTTQRPPRLLAQGPGAPTGVRPSRASRWRNDGLRR